MWWWLLTPARIAFYYLALPLLIWKTHRIEETPTIQKIDPRSLPLPTDVLQHFDAVEVDLQKLGFESRSTLLLPSTTPNVISLLRFFVNPFSKVSAMANSMITTIKTDLGNQVRHHPYMEFTTRYDDGQVFNTLNSSAAGSFPPAPKSLTVRVSWVRDPTQLHMIHDSIMRSRNIGRGRILRLDETFGGDEIAFLQACMKEELQHATKAGYVRLAPENATYRATLRGAYLMTWKEQPPWKQLIARRDRRRAERIMEDAGVVVK
jgi:hypothetical protein